MIYMKNSRSNSPYLQKYLKYKKKYNELRNIPSRHISMRGGSGTGCDNITRNQFESTAEFKAECRANTKCKIRQRPLKCIDKPSGFPDMSDRLSNRGEEVGVDEGVGVDEAAGSQEVPVSTDLYEQWEKGKGKGKTMIYISDEQTSTAIILTKQLKLLGELYDTREQTILPDGGEHKMPELYKGNDVFDLKLYIGHMEDSGDIMEDIMEDISKSIYIKINGYYIELGNLMLGDLPTVRVGNINYLILTINPQKPKNIIQENIKPV